MLRPGTFLFAGLLGLLTICGTYAKGPKITDPKKADADFGIQGEYVGTVQTSEGETKIGVQVIALGQGRFHSVAYLGGLPGDGYNGDETFQADGAMNDGKVTFSYERATAVIRDGVLVA